MPIKKFVNEKGKVEGMANYPNGEDIPNPDHPSDYLIVEYRVWIHDHKNGEDDTYEKFNTLEEANEAKKRMEKSKPKGAFVEKPLMVILRNHRYYETDPKDVNKRCSDMIYNMEIVGRLVGTIKEVLEASISDKKQLKALKNIVTDRIYDWWRKEGE